MKLFNKKEIVQNNTNRELVVYKWNSVKKKKEIVAVSGALDHFGTYTEGFLTVKTKLNTYLIPKEEYTTAITRSSKVII